MRPPQKIEAVDTHVCGEPGRVIVGGVPDVPGRTMFDKKNREMTVTQEERVVERGLLVNVAPVDVSTGRQKIFRDQTVTCMCRIDYWNTTTKVHLVRICPLFE